MIFKNIWQIYVYIIRAPNIDLLQFYFYLLFKASENALTAANSSSDAQQLERDQIVKLKKVIPHTFV